MTNGSISIYDSQGVDRAAKELKIDPQRIRRARTLFFKKSRDIDSAFESLPASIRSQLLGRIATSPLRVFERLDSPTGQATKLLLRNSDGYALESVIMRPTTGRTALCVSSQVGCAAACRFCATGHMGVAKNLTADEILAQVTLANAIVRTEGRRVRNIVFMGMGEPLHNTDAVTKALGVLQDPTTFDHPASRLLVSTVGIPDSLIEVAEKFPSVNFALSLHSADQAKREKLIPLARRYDLESLRVSVQRLNLLQPAKNCVMIEHLMLDGFNDAAADCERLLDWARGLRVHFNLIPFNPVADAPELRSTPGSRIRWFANQLKSHGFPTTIRFSMGRDIDAACGQLVRSENRKHAQTRSSRTNHFGERCSTTNSPRLPIALEPGEVKTRK